MTPLLQELHWLPIKFRPQCKIGTFVYRFFDGCLPGYLSETLCAYKPTRNLRSSCQKLLKVQKRNTKTLGERSFSFLAPSVWTLCHPNSEILLPFLCLNPDSKLTSSWQLSASRISAVCSPPPPLTPPTPRMNVLPGCFSCLTIVKRETEREGECREQERWWVVRDRVCESKKGAQREREGERERKGGVCVCARARARSRVCVCVCVCVCVHVLA